MQAVVATTTLTGVDAIPVEVQADVSPGLPMFGIVGLADTAVQEARDRVRASIRAAGFDFPNARVIVNLAPAPVRKHGTGFDLPIALAILQATGQVRRDAFAAVTSVGELGLDGSVRRVPGMLAHAIAAARADRPLLGPTEAVSVVGHVPQLRYHGLEALESVRAGLPAQACVSLSPTIESRDSVVDIDDIAGHETAKRGLEIGAVGGHHVLMIGPPGSGKTMLAHAVCGLLPVLSEPERLESALVYSVAGLDASAILGGMRPFRAPHHSSSVAGLVGGGSPPRPGEISLAHNGVLFLDELPEFAPAALQSLRQPMEQGVVTLVRAAGTVRYPARAAFVAAMNPCPCGSAGDARRPCTCSPGVVARYTGRVGGPLYDRMDITLRVDRVDPGVIITDRPPGSASRAARERIEAARAFAHRRGSLGLRASLTAPAGELLESAARASHLSGRGVCRVLRVARSIADLEQSQCIGADHIAEALGFRGWEVGR